MPKLWIDSREVDVQPGETILDAARKLGIRIPTLCFLQGRQPCTSCMVCMVKLSSEGRLVPACGTLAADGMQVDSETDEVRHARRFALELLLSDHVGDCIGPCHAICPAQMNIPRMIRQIAAGDLRGAAATVKRDIALPATLGRICPAPCEKGCRRAAHDAPVSICLLKRFVADADLASGEPYLPHREPANGKRVAIIGAGPAGLGAAFHLLQHGYACTIFDDHNQPGGMLRYGVDEDRLPRDVLDAEIAVILKLGVEFRPGTRVASANALLSGSDAVLVAAGELKEGDADRFGLPTTPQGIEVSKHTHESPVKGVFAAGGAVRSSKMAVRSLAEGKAAALAIHQYLSGQTVAGAARSFTTRIGQLLDGELERFLAEASRSGRIVPARDGFSADEAHAEARRCLHCDCRKAEHCKLRHVCSAYEARTTRYKAPRRPFEQHLLPGGLIYEPGKCIACGLCVQIAAEAGEPLDLTFAGRGFNVRVREAFAGPRASAVSAELAAQCVAACPTGALALTDGQALQP